MRLPIVLAIALPSCGDDIPTPQCAFECWSMQIIQDASSDYACIEGMTHAGGTYVAVGVRKAPGQTDFAPWAWHSSDAANWIPVELAPSATVSTQAFSVIHDGTQWIASGMRHHTNSAAGNALLWTSTDLAQWTEVALETWANTTYSHRARAYSVDFDGTSYVATGSLHESLVDSTSHPNLWYASNVAGPWTSSRVHAQGGEIFSLAKHGADWLLGGFVEDTPDKATLWLSSNPGGPWNAVFAPSPSNKALIRDVAYNNGAGQWMAVGAYDVPRENPAEGVIPTATLWESTDGLSWNATMLPFENWSDPQALYVSPTAGTLIVDWGGAFERGTGTWIRHSITSAEDGHEPIVRDVVEVNGTWLAAGCDRYNNQASANPAVFVLQPAGAEERK